MRGERRALMIGAAAVIGVAVALAFTPYEQSAGAPAGLILIIPPSKPTFPPTARPQNGQRTAAGAALPEHRVEHTDADVTLLDARFGNSPVDPALALRAERLKTRIEQIMIGAVRFRALQVECRSKLCRLTGSAIDGIKAADHASAFALLHRPELVAIGAAEGLDPGPIEATMSTDDTRFVAYLVTP